MRNLTRNDKTLEWELITDQDFALTKRFKVDGGHIYKTVNTDNHNYETVALCFVPEIDLTRYQSHLRDAYNKGFEDGSRERKGG